MANNRELYWLADKSRSSGGRWRAIYKGKPFQYGKVNGKSDRLGKDRATEAFKHFKAKQDADAFANKPHRHDYERAIKLRMEMLEWTRLEGLTDDPSFHQTHDRLTTEIKRLQSDLAKVQPPPLNLLEDVTIHPDALWVFPLVGMFASEADAWIHRLESLRDYKRWTQAPDQSITVSAKIAEYLQRQLTRATSGQIKPSTYKASFDRIPFFGDYAGTMDATKIDERTLSSFHAHLLQQIANDEKGDGYAKSIFNEARAFVRWLWRERVLEHLPRNIDSLTIKLEHAEIKTFSPAEIKTLVNAASEKTRLYLLLMLNCGMYQSDIAELKPSEFDVKGKCIVRKRTKTRNASQNVPVVSWRLWDETYNLLVKLRETSPKAECLLTNENGLSVYRRILKADGDYSETDNIQVAYQRVCRKLKIKKPKALMLLRKTGASKLEEHETYGRFSQYYLGQAPQSLAERRYAKPSPEQFDKAMVWLGKQFGFNTRTSH